MDMRVLPRHVYWDCSLRATEVKHWRMVIRLYIFEV